MRYTTLFNRFSQRDSNKMDPNGGIVLTDSAQIDNAQKAVLITMPQSIQGTNCGNCKFFSNNFCNHAQMQLQVNERQCCNYWNSAGTYFVGKQ